MSEQRRPPIVAVHGAWQGGWAFDAWRPALAAAGWELHAPDLPGNGCDPADTTSPDEIDLARYVARVRAVVEDLAAETGGPVVLLGHSGGAITAMQVAEEVPELVGALVCLAGIMLPNGRYYNEFLREWADDVGHDLSDVEDWCEISADGRHSSVPPTAARRYFLHDAEESVAMAAAGRLTPQPIRGLAITPSVTAERFGTVPLIYVAAADDRSVLPGVQQRMIHLTPPDEVLTLACGHVPQVVAPGELTALLTPILERHLGAVGVS